MRRRVLVPALLLGLLLAPGLGAEGGIDLTGAAADWLASLDAGQRRTALHDFDDAERFDLRLAPLFLEGLRRDAMSDAQWQGWRRVLEATLSPAGLAKVETVMSLEREVRLRDRQSWLWSWFGGFVHGENRYYASLFGAPSVGEPWGLRFDGHHVSLNWTVAADGRISTTPSFLGSEPREVPEGWERAGLRVLAEEEDSARSLWQSLDADQRTQAEIAFAPASGPQGANRPLFRGEGERIDLAEPAGIAREQLDPTQAALLDAVVETYLARLATPLRDARRRAIDAASRDALHFAWSGSFTPGEPLYYRVQGPTLLIEYDDTVPEADHVHTIVRDTEGDFGRDLLAEHHAAAHTHDALRPRASAATP